MISQIDIARSAPGDMLGADFRLGIEPESLMVYRGYIRTYKLEVLNMSTQSTYPHSSHNSATRRADSHGVTIAGLAAVCPVEQGRDYCAVCCAVVTDDPAPIPAPVLGEYTLSDVRTNSYPATGRAISHIYVLRTQPAWWPGEGRAVALHDVAAGGGNRLYAYRWNCDSRWTVVDGSNAQLTTLVESEEQAREMLTAGLKARGLI